MLESREEWTATYKGRRERCDERNESEEGGSELHVWLLELEENGTEEKTKDDLTFTVHLCCSLYEKFRIPRVLEYCGNVVAILGLPFGICEKARASRE
jgi:hypothetical protein